MYAHLKSLLVHWKHAFAKARSTIPRSDAFDFLPWHTVHPGDIVMNDWSSVELGVVVNVQRSGNKDTANVMWL